MTCIFCDEDGICQLTYEGNIEIERPVDEKGHCLCEDNENPEDSCEDYQER